MFLAMILAWVVCSRVSPWEPEGGSRWCRRVRGYPEGPGLRALTGQEQQVVVATGQQAVATGQRAVATGGENRGGGGKGIADYCRDALRCHHVPPLHRVP